MARKTLAARTTAAWWMFRQASRKLLKIWTRPLRFGQTRSVVLPGPVLLAGQSRGGFLAMHYAGLQARPGHGRGEFLRWLVPLRTSDHAILCECRPRRRKVPQLWLYADNDRLYDETLIREYYQAFSAAGGSARFELLARHSG